MPWWFWVLVGLSVFIGGGLLGWAAVASGDTTREAWVNRNKLPRGPMRDHPRSKDRLP